MLVSFSFKGMNKSTEKYLQAFDELNNLSILRSETPTSESIDEIEELLILGYVLGRESAAESLLFEIGSPDTKRLDDLLMVEYDGKTFIDRVEEYSESGSEEEIKRVVETEYHRMFNQGVLDGANEISNENEIEVTKKWVTVGDNKVRETHSYLEGMEIPLNEKFYTIDSDSADFPGGFSNAENNINCRCVVEVNGI